MARNIFDQFDAPADQGGNVFDQFDDAPAGRPSLARPMIGTADPSAAPSMRQSGMTAPAGGERSAMPARQDPNDPNQALLQSHYDTEAALSQRAAPLVRNAKGELVRKVIGEIEEFDFGPAIRTPTGDLLAFNPKTDVMLRDPQTGKLTAFERSQGGMDNPGFIERLGRAILPGFMTTAPTRLASSAEVPLAVQRGRALGFPVSARTAQTGERIEDAAAFGQLDTEPFAPAFRSKGAARIARTIEEMPLVGGLVKGPKSETEANLAQAQARIASELGAPATDEAAGRVLQTGLDRFRTAGVQNIEPGVLAERGIEARAPVQPTQVLSRGARESAEAAEPIRAELGGGVAETARGVQVSAARPLNQVVLARRSVEDMDDAELLRLVRSPASETSFGVRQEALYERAHRSIPSLFRSDNSRNPNLIATPNAGQVARGLQRAEESARVRGGALEGRFGQLVQDLQNARSNFTLDSLKAARTEIGRVLASFGEYDARLDRSQLKALYAGISRDYEAGLQTLANRAYERTKLSNNAPDYVPPEVARAADRALRDMRVADRYTRLSIERMDRFTRLLNADSPEAAMRGLSSRIREGTIDRGMVRAVADALRPDEREAVLGYLVSNMGKTRPGGKESEIIWNIHTFATDWNRNKVALRLLSKGTDPKIVDRLEALAKTSERMKYYETTKNYSGSAYAGIPFAGVIGGASGGIPGMILTALTLAGGSAAAGKFLTTPKYLNWMVRAAAEGQVPRAAGPQVGGTKAPAIITTLERLAANDNELGPIVREAITRFRNQAADPASVDPQTGAEGGDAFDAETQSGYDRQEHANAPLHGGDISPSGGASPSGDIPLSDMGPQPGQEWPSGSDPSGGQKFMDILSYPLRRVAEVTADTQKTFEAFQALPVEQQEDELKKMGVEIGLDLRDYAISSAIPFGVGKGVQLIGRAAQAAPKATATVLGASGLAGTSSTTGETQARAAPSEETRALQRKLKDAGYYTGPLDGITGAATQSALEKFEEAESKKRAEEREQAKLNLESARTAAEARKAQAELAETERKAKAAEEETRRRIEGDARLKEIEKNVPWYSSAVRSYGPAIGWGVGAALGLTSRIVVVKTYNYIAERTAQRANALMSGGGDWASRQARVNQFWGEGQSSLPVVGRREPPFLAAPGQKPPFRSNPNAPAGSDLYQPSVAKNLGVDAGVVGAGAFESVVTDQMLGARARADLIAAREEMQKDPSEANIARYQGALDLVAYSNLISNIGRGIALGYVGTAAEKRRDTQIRPNISAAEAERARIDAYVERTAPKPGTGPKRSGQATTVSRGASTPSAEPNTQQSTGRTTRGPQRPAAPSSEASPSEPTPGKSGKTWHDDTGKFTSPPKKAKDRMSFLDRVKFWGGYV